MGYPPTDEQQAAIDIATTGDNCVIQALAGTGKTSTLRMIAERRSATRFQFVAFNKAIVNDVTGSFPDNVVANTAHSLAFRTVGVKYRDRLNGGRMRPMDMARLLRVDAFDYAVMGTPKRLGAGFCAGLVKRAIDRFCQTDDPEPTTIHVPFVPGLDEPRVAADGTRLNARGPNHVALTKHLESAIAYYWKDVLDVNGRLPFSHGCYLKMWELTDPVIPADTILFDEGQDASPVMLSIVGQQEAQLILVGDSYQSIYGWTGAVDALERADPDAPRTWLTRSFRFGGEIAEVANDCLALLDAPVTVDGAGGPGEVTSLERADAYLYRTNAKAVAHVLQSLRAGERVALVGGADDVVSFARGAKDLQTGQRSYHPELACFDSWGEVCQYVNADPLGSDLKLFVDLVEDFGADTIISELRRVGNENQADTIVSTAHKSKGREWDAVAIGGDFPDPEHRDVSDEEKRLLYVAVTRARKQLDIDGVALLSGEEE